MDATDDNEVFLQRASVDLLKDLQSAIPKCLFRNGKPRRVIRTATLYKQLQRLDHFQEFPQLLDPSLSVILPHLVDALLCSLELLVRPGSSTEFTILLPFAVSRMLYALCKARGPKVISRFFHNEARYLEPLLEVFEIRLHQKSSAGRDGDELPPLVWEERYILLLWLGHLILTPFPLTSVGGSSKYEQTEHPSSHFVPDGTPAIASRVWSIAQHHIGSASKEREAAIMLLVRLVLRPDMHAAGFLGASVEWAVLHLNGYDTNVSSTDVYHYIGVLSFLGGVVKSTDAKIIAPFLQVIFGCIQNVIGGVTPTSEIMMSSASARKAIIKIYRSVSIAAIALSCEPEGPYATLSGVVIEDVIDYLLTALADNDTPVRHAASKALSVITVKLDPRMGEEVIEAVVGSLEENVIWEDPSSQPGKSDSPSSCTQRTRNLSLVSPLRWQGLTLTLSHLLFRRSPPASSLASILNALLLALSFEQRSSASTSIGTSVRDAANFGIWSLVRRYTTAELENVDTTTIRAVGIGNNKLSILQIVACELVCTASADPAGNIRRGASAALQELVGRHPDTVIQGIELVQVVDYHAVALRSRALKQVAVRAGKLDHIYWQYIMRDLTSWRGVNAVDAVSRRYAAEAIGRLALVEGTHGLIEASNTIRGRIHSLSETDVEGRHGLLLSATALVREAGKDRSIASKHGTIPELSRFWTLLEPGFLLHDKDFNSSVLRPQLTSEAVCTLISALAEASTGPASCIAAPEPQMIDQCIKYVNFSLTRREELPVIAAATAAKACMDHMVLEKRKMLVQDWAVKVTTGAGFGDVAVTGYLTALGAVYSKHDGEAEVQESIVDALLRSLDHGVRIERKVAAVKALTEGIIPSGGMTTSIADRLLACLRDYTTDRRGDVGSLVRAEAINAVRVAGEYGLVKTAQKQDLIAAVCVLAVEKLDKVRFQAWCCLRTFWDMFGLPTDTFRDFNDVGQVSSTTYFLQMLALSSISWTHIPLLRGLVSSTGAGSESVLQASREALATHVERLNAEDLAVFCRSLMTVLRENVDNERLIVPILETIAYLLQTRNLDELKKVEFRWRPLLVLIQKSHFKSRSVPKCLAAIEVYTGLAAMKEVEEDTLKKLAGFLLHSFPKVRNAAADALFILTQTESLAEVDWLRPVKENKEAVDAIERGFVLSAKWSL